MRLRAPAQDDELGSCSTDVNLCRNLGPELHNWETDSAANTNQVIDDDERGVTFDSGGRIGRRQAPGDNSRFESDGVQSVLYDPWQGGRDVMATSPAARVARRRHLPSTRPLLPSTARIGRKLSRRSPNAATTAARRRPPRFVLFTRTNGASGGGGPPPRRRRVLRRRRRVGRPPRLRLERAEQARVHARDCPGASSGPPPRTSR